MTIWPESLDGDHEIQLRTGVGDRRLTVWPWMESHSMSAPSPGPHLAICGIPQVGGQATSLVVHLDQVPALVAALTAASANLARVWERDGEEYWRVHQPAPEP